MYVGEEGIVVAVRRREAVPFYGATPTAQRLPFYGATATAVSYTFIHVFVNDLIMLASECNVGEEVLCIDVCDLVQCSSSMNINY